MISELQLKAIMRRAPAGRLALYAPLLSAAMAEYGIILASQQAAFLAQVAHESGELRYTREMADGKGYEGRADLGNTEQGDGPRFPGRGLLQITGRANYKACAEATGIDCVNFPELLEEPANAARSAAWFWRDRGLNELAAQGRFGAVTKRINGGYNGLDERIAFWIDARQALGVPS